MRHPTIVSSKYIIRAKKFYVTNTFLISLFKYLLSLYKSYFDLCICFTMFGIISYNMSPYFIKYKLLSIKICYITICSTKKNNTNKK